MIHIHQKTPRTNSLLSCVVLGLLIALGSVGCSASAGTDGGSITVKDLYQTLGQDKTSRVLDVRTLREYDSGHIAGAVNVPLKNLATRIDRVDADKSQTIYVVSGTDEQTAEAVALLEAEGYSRVSDVAGGMNAWSAKRYPVEK